MNKGGWCATPLQKEITFSAQWTVMSLSQGQLIIIRDWLWELVAGLKRMITKEN